MLIISALRRACLLAVLLLSSPLHAAPYAAPASAADPVSKPASDLTAQIAALLRQQGLAGAVWTTLDAHGAAGVSDARSGTPMRADQRVHVGSVAKTLLATGILRLVSQGRLSLDTPVATVLPAMEFDNPWHAGDPVRIRHLIDHSAGLDDLRLWHLFTQRAQADVPLGAAFPSGSGLLRSRSRPGARFSYSNISYTLLGMVIETLTRQRYETYLDKELLAPLGMHDSTFAFVAQQRDPRLAMGHFDDGSTHPAVPSFVRPAGQFTTTAADMGRFARFLMSDGSVGGQPFIDPALLRRMGEPAGTEAARAGLQVGYGLGLRAIDRHGVVARCHGGNAVGYRAMLCLFPSTQQAFFIALNADSETADYHQFDALLIRSLMPALPVPALPTAAHVDTRPWEGWYIPSPNRFDTMRFADIVTGFMRVSRDGVTLRLHPAQANEIVLRHAGHGLFRAPDKLLPSHALLVSAEGTRVVTNGTQTYEQIALTRLLLLWLSVGAGLLGMTAILIAGVARLAMRRLARHDPLLAPFAGVLALMLPLPLFFQQSFLQLGDVTPASMLLAIVTGALPLAMLTGLALSLRRTTGNRVEPMAVAMLAVLQLTGVLAAWGLLPLRFWV